MYFHREARLIYLAHPRTASTSTAEGLQALGFELMHSHHGQLRCLPIVPGYRLQREHWHAVTCIRNHFDVAVSWVWRRTHGRPNAWNRDTFEWALTRPVNRWIGERTMLHLHVDDADEVLRYEEFPESLYDVLERFGLPRVKLNRQAQGRGRDGRSYREYYDDASREYIEKRFGKEMERLGYAF